MTEKQFETLLENSFANFGDDLLDLPEEMSEPHTFSPDFERRMKRIMRSKVATRRPVPIRMSTRRGIAAAVAVMLTAVAATATATAKSFPSDDFMLEESKGYTSVICRSIKDAPKTIEEYYTVTALPDYFEVGYEFREWGWKNGTCVASSYGDNHYEILRFEQATKDTYSSNFNTAVGRLEEITFSGYNAVYVDFSTKWHDSGNLVWVTEDYVFYLDGTFSKDELIAFAKSVQKVER